MGAPTLAAGVPDTLTVRDNRTGKTYTIPYATLALVILGLLVTDGVFAGFLTTPSQRQSSK